MTVTVQANEDAQRYEAVDESGVVAGFAEYVDRGVNSETRVLTHSEVDDAFEGQGIGSTLAREAIEQSLDAGRGLVVECSFIRSWLERHPEYAARVSASRDGNQGDR
jgi:predicted GNAT family acetyltransferase